MSQRTGPGFRTEIEFTLPKGYLDEHGVLHRQGMMRLATAADEILPLRDPRVQQNAAYLTIIVMARVIERLGSLPEVDTEIVEGLYASDLDYLQRLYEQINALEESDAVTAIPATQTGKRACCARGAPRWGKPDGLSAQPSLRGDGFHRVPLPLESRRADGPRARGTSPLVSRNFGGEPPPGWHAGQPFRHGLS